MRDRDRDDTAATVREYLARGWAVVPVDARDKSPNIQEWPELARRRDFKPYDFEGRNIGVVLGPVSGDLVDIDLDSEAALQLAPYFLPETRTFGRRSKRASHWIYKAPGARFDQLKFGPKDRRELVEIRAQNTNDDGCGHQSVFPGSVHQSGERIEWDNDRDIESVDAGDLAWRVARLAVASVILDGWVEGGGRNVKSLGVTGGLLKMGWRAEEVRECMRAVREVSGLDREDDARAVDNTIKNYEKNPDNVTGFGSLVTDGDLAEHELQSLRRHARTPVTRALEAGILNSRLGRHVDVEHLHDERNTGGMLERVDNRHRVRRGPEPTDSDLLGLGRLVSLATPPVPLRYFCKGLQLTPGKVSGISGYGGMGKGPLLMYMLLCFASGEPIFGHPVERQRCVHFDFETGPMTRWRFERFARWMRLDLAKLEADSWISFVDAGGKKIDGPWLDDLDHLVSKAGLGAIGIDSYSSAVAGDQNDSTYADVAWALGDISNRRNVLVMPVVHENKGTGGKRADDDLKMVAGNGALAFAMQSVLTLSRPDPLRRAKYEIRSARGPEGGFAPFTVEWHDVEAPESVSRGELVARGEDPAKWGLEVRVVDGDSAPVAVGGRQQDELLRIAGEVVRYLDGQGVGGKSLTRIRSIVSGSNTTIKNVVASLAAEGVLARLPDDTYELASPGRDNAEARLRWGVANSGRRRKNDR